MKRLVIHIGMHKTGSSSIQRTLHANRSLLEKSDIHFPEFGSRWGTCNHSLVGYLALANRGDWIVKQNMAGSEKTDLQTLKRRARDLFEETLGAHRRGVLVISGEELSMIAKSGVERLDEQVHRHFDEVAVIAYARPPIEWMASLTCGQVRRGKTLASIFARSIRPEYRRRFNPYLKHFGDDFTVRRYSRKALYRGCVVADFLHFTGAPDSLYDSLDKSPVGSNSGLSDKAVRLLDRINTCAEQLKLGPVITRRIAHVSAALLPRSANRYALPDTVQQALLNESQRDWLWVESLIEKTNSAEIDAVP